MVRHDMVFGMDEIQAVVVECGGVVDDTAGVVADGTCISYGTACGDVDGASVC